MKITQWDYSDMNTDDFDEKEVTWVEGDYTFKIISASFCPPGTSDDIKSDGVYNLTLKCLDGECEGGILYQRFWMFQKDGSKNLRAFGTIGSIGKSIYGSDHGIPPAPSDAEGCVVRGHLEFDSKGYARIYHFTPANIRFADQGKADQNYIYE